MAATQPSTPWRGYVHELTYGGDLHKPLDDQAVDGIVDALLAQRVFTSPVETYYTAAVDALRSGQPLADLPGQDETATRDALTRIVERLDRRRPWPIHPFYQRNVDEWSSLASAPVIGRVPASEMAVLDTLHRVFDVGPDGRKVMILGLRTGQLVALRPTGGFITPGIDVLAHTEPESTLADLRKLTGLEVERG